MFIRNLPELSDTRIKGLDIGCSGSKPMEWDRLENKLIYFGVDPLENEINKLKKKFPNETYISAFVTDIGCTGQADQITTKFFQRTSAAADMRQGFDLIKENFNSNMDVVYSKLQYTVPELLKKLNIDNLDLLKIDVDGDDFPLLKAFLELSENFTNNLLAFEIESQFHGDSGEYGNNFGNILQLANRHGFYLYKLDSYTYSRNSLRKPYIYDFPAQTKGGQVMWGDALFARDGLEIEDPIQIKKLALILDIYELEDCAFEIIEENSDLLSLHPEQISVLKDRLLQRDTSHSYYNEDKKRKLISKVKKFIRV